MPASRTKPPRDAQQVGGESRPKGGAHRQRQREAEPRHSWLRHSPVSRTDYGTILSFLGGTGALPIIPASLPYQIDRVPG